MTRRMIRRDPIENEIELALSPGSYIRDRACFSFVSSLVEVAAQIAELQPTDAARAVGLYETFLAGCREKAEELDDSSGSFGQFAKDLICRWIKARQASGAGPDGTAATLLVWMDNDPYAFCYQIEKEVARAFDKAGLAAFERLIRARFEAPSEQEYDRRRWSDALRAVYLAQRNPFAYEALAEQVGLDPRDCLALATIFVSRNCLGNATLANVSPSPGSLAGFAFWRAGMTVRMLSMPTWGLLGGSGRLPVAQPRSAGRQTQVETWCLPPSMRSSTSKEPSGRTESLSTPWLIDYAEAFADHLHGSTRAARRRFPASKNK